jgi:hypothetical protein
MTVFEFEPDVVSVEAVVAEVFPVLVVVVVVSGARAPPTSSLKALPPLGAAAAAADAAGTWASPSAAHSASTAMREPRDATPHLLTRRGYRPAGELMPLRPSAALGIGAGPPDGAPAKTNS